MDFVDVASGKPVSLDPGAADAGVKSGALAVRKGSSLAITKDGDANVYTATDADVGDWFKKGYRLASNAETAAYDAKKAAAQEAQERSDNPILSASAAVGGFAKGALLAEHWVPRVVGALDAATGEGTYEAGKARAEAGFARLAEEHQTADLAGQAAAFLSPLAEAGLASKAVRGTSLATKAAPLVEGLSAVSLVPKAIGKAGEAAGALGEAIAGAENATRLGRAATGAVRAVSQFEVENALIAGQAAAQEAALSDRDFTPVEFGQAFAHHALPGALWGGALVGVLGGAAGAFSRVDAKLAEGATDAASAAAEDGKTLASRGAKFREDEALRSTGLAPSDRLAIDEAERRVPGTKARAVDMILHEVPEATGKTGTVAKALATPAELMPGVESVVKKYGERIGASYSKLDEAAAATGIRFDTDAGVSKLRERIEHLRDIPGMKPVVAKLENELVEIEEAFGSSRAVAAERARLLDEAAKAERDALRAVDKHEAVVGAAKAERDQFVKGIKAQASDEANAAVQLHRAPFTAEQETRLAAAEKRLSAMTAKIDADATGLVTKTRGAEAELASARDAMRAANSEVNAAEAALRRAKRPEVALKSGAGHASIVDEAARRVTAAEAKAIAAESRVAAAEASLAGARAPGAPTGDALSALTKEVEALRSQKAMAGTAVYETAKDIAGLGAELRATIAAREADLFELPANAKRLAALEKKIDRGVAASEREAQRLTDAAATLRRQADELAPKNPKFAALHEYRAKLDDRINWSMSTDRALDKELQAHRAHFEEQFIKDGDRAAAAAGESFRAGYEADKQGYQAAKLIERALKRGAGKEGAQGGFTKSDFAMGLFGGIGGVAYGALSALAWHGYRAHGARIGAYIAEGLFKGSVARSAADVARTRIGAAAKAAATGDKVAVEAGAVHLPAFERAATDVREAAASPAAFERRLDGAAQLVAEHSPEAAMSMKDTARRAVLYLDGLLTKPAAPMPFAAGEQPPLVAEVDKQRFMGAAKAVQDPTGTIQRAANGDASRAELAAVREVYPGLFAYFRKSTLETLASLPKPPRMEIMLIIEDMLGEPLLPGSRAQNILAAQKAWRRDMGVPEPGPAGGGRSPAPAPPPMSSPGPRMRPASPTTTSQFVSSRRTETQATES